MIRFKFLHTAALHDDEKGAMRTLLDTCFDGDFADSDWDHALGGMHVLAYDEDALVGHGCVVQRSMLMGEQPMRCGYIEAIAVQEQRRGEGIGGNITAWLTEFVKQAYDFGALGATDLGRPVYERHGWQEWRGELAVMAPDGLRAQNDDRGSVLVLQCATPLDLDARLACDWRIGDVW